MVHAYVRYQYRLSCPEGADLQREAWSFSVDSVGTAHLSSSFGL